MKYRPRFQENAVNAALKISLTVLAAGGALLGAAVMAAPPTPMPGPEGASLQVYFIDVEGGQSTLIVTPDRQSLLIDTGWAGNGTGFNPGDPHEARDANRIVAAARDAVSSGSITCTSRTFIPITMVASKSFLN